MEHYIDQLDQSTPVQQTQRPAFSPTGEQLAIVDAAVSTKDNLLISALAGAAKTSTLVLLASHPQMQQVATLTLAFNKKIAEEMKTRLPSNCISKTLNSLGHSVWATACGRRLNVDTKKNFNLVKELINAEKRNDVKDALYENMSELMRTLAHGKTTGWVPDEVTIRNKRLLDNAAFFGSLDEAVTLHEERLLIAAMRQSIDLAYIGQIDFDDQVFMPTCFFSRFPSYPLTMIDEAQDLSSLNHFMLEQIVGINRLIAVGDPNQAIYAFRGAYGDSMERLRHKFSMHEYQLSTSFRCPKAVVEEAHWRAPSMTAPEWAKPGLVSSPESWNADTLPSNAVIICRNNAPLFKMAITLLIEGRYPELVGNDIGKSLLKAMDKLGSPEQDRETSLKALELYKVKRLAKTREQARDGVEDFCRCIEIFLANGDTLGGAISYAQHLMTATGPIKLMTGHKSKGLEFSNVFILDRHLLRLKEDGGKNQDRNLLYVMQTRSQDRLFYVTSEGFVGAGPKTEE